MVAPLVAAAIGFVERVAAKKAARSVLGRLAGSLSEEAGTARVFSASEKLKKAGKAGELAKARSEALTVIRKEASAMRTGKRVGQGVKVDKAARASIDLDDVVERIVGGESPYTVARDELVKAARLETRIGELVGEDAVDAAKAVGKANDMLHKIQNASNDPKKVFDILKKEGFTKDEKGSFADPNGVKWTAEEVQKAAADLKRIDPASANDPEATAHRLTNKLNSVLGGHAELFRRFNKSINSAGVQNNPDLYHLVMEAASKMGPGSFANFISDGTVNGICTYLTSDRNVIVKNMDDMLQALGVDPREMTREELSW